jgi:hypothetical protein
VAQLPLLTAPPAGLEFPVNTESFTIDADPGLSMAPPELDAVFAVKVHRSTVTVPISTWIAPPLDAPFPEKVSWLSTASAFPAAALTETAPPRVASLPSNAVPVTVAILPVTSSPPPL